MNQQFKDRPRTIRMTVFNADSVQIPSGEPVVLKLDGVGDGAEVVKPSTGTAAIAHATVQGITLGAIAAGAYGDVCVYGFVKECKVIKQSRAASTDSFASFAAGVLGDRLRLDPVNDGLIRSDAAAASAAMPWAVLCEAYASGASSASTTSNSSLIVSDTLQVWIMLM